MLRCGSAGALTGLDWTGLDWTGLDWTGFDWIYCSAGAVLLLEAGLILTRTSRGHLARMAVRRHRKQVVSTHRAEKAAAAKQRVASKVARAQQARVAGQGRRVALAPVLGSSLVGSTPSLPSRQDGAGVDPSPPLQPPPCVQTPVPPHRRPLSSVGGSTLHRLPVNNAPSAELSCRSEKKLEPLAYIYTYTYKYIYKYTYICRSEKKL